MVLSEPQGINVAPDDDDHLPFSNPPRPVHAELPPGVDAQQFRPDTPGEFRDNEDFGLPGPPGPFGFDGPRSFGGDGPGPFGPPGPFEPEFGPDEPRFRDQGNDYFVAL